MLKVFGRKVSSWKLVLLAGDTIAYGLAVALAMVVNPKIDLQDLAITHNFLAIILAGLTYLLVLYIADLYEYQQDFRRWPTIGRLLFAILVGTISLIVLFYFPNLALLGRWQLLIQTGFFTPLLLAWRWLFSSLALPRRLKRQILIIGAGKAGRRLLEAVRRRQHSGLEVMGFIDDDPQKLGTEIEGVPVLGTSADIQAIHKQFQVKVLVLAITHEKSQQLLKELTRIGWNGCQVLDMPSFYEYLANKVPIDHISDVWLFLNSLRPHLFYYRHLKRLMDLALSILGLLITAPLFLLIALLIKLEDRGPIFFIQERLGQDGKPFNLIKFRTMRPDAEANGPQWAADQDERVTRVGRRLRQYRLDELPQLLNVIIGDMSLIGPRPEREVFIQEFMEPVSICRSVQYGNLAVPLLIDEIREKVPYYSYRLLVKPGITGWAQVMYPYASSLEETKEKLQYDLYYIKNMSFFLDLAILLKTIRIICFAKGR